MKAIEDVPMLGIGSDAVLAALATVVRKPRNSYVRTSSPALVLKRPTKSVAPSAAATRTDVPFNVHDKGPPMFGNGDETVLGTLDTVKLQHKTKNISAKTTTTTLQLTGSPMVDIDATTLDTLVPYPRNTLVTTNDTLPLVSPSVMTTASSLPVEDSLNIATSVVPKAKTHATIGPSAKTIPTSSVVDLTESTRTISPKVVTNRQERSKNCRQDEVAEDTVGIPTGNFRTIQSGVQIRMQTSVVDYWFSAEARGEGELIKYVKEAVKTIKIGMDTLNNEGMVKQLGAAVRRGVTVQLFIHFKTACDGGLEWVKSVLEAGVQVCHSTEKFEWKAAIFDGQILVQGDLRVFNTGYTMVYTGDIASVLECQFDTMWKVATMKAKGGKRARTDTGMGHREEVESSDFEAEAEPGKKRKQGKRTYFQTTLTFLEMLGL